jgi:hypothetical protein
LFASAVLQEVSRLAARASKRPVRGSSAASTVADSTAIASDFSRWFDAVFRFTVVTDVLIVLIHAASQAERGACYTGTRCQTVFLLTLHACAVTVTVLTASSTGGAHVLIEVVAHVRLAFRAFGIVARLHLSRALLAAAGAGKTLGSILGGVVGVTQDDSVVEAVVTNAHATSIISAFLTGRRARLAGFVSSLEEVALDVLA